jgi:hypothetical protein
VSRHLEPIKSSLTTAALAEVDPHQLHHVGLQEVDIPPGRLLHLGEGAGRQVEEGAGAAIHRLLRDPALRHAGLHGSLPGGHIQNCKQNNEILVFNNLLSWNLLSLNILRTELGNILSAGEGIMSVQGTRSALKTVQDAGIACRKVPQNVQKLS